MDTKISISDTKPKKKKKNKYKSKKVIVEGIKFDSEDEAKFYEHLKALKTHKQIIDFDLQPKFELIPAFEKMGKHYRAITYTADFLIYYPSNYKAVIDIKGFSSQQGELRKKLFDYKYPELQLRWIARSLKYGASGWIDYFELQKIRRKNKKLKAKDVSLEG